MAFLSTLWTNLGAALLPYRLILIFVAVAALSAWMWHMGVQHGEKSLLEAKIESQAQTAVTVQEQTAVTTKSLVKYIDRIQYIQGKTRTIIQKVNVYVKDTCVLSDDWRMLHDTAASSAVPGASGKVDGGSNTP
jgi:hypothetical protein